jgi:hypothetical protein
MIGCGSYNPPPPIVRSTSHLTRSSSVPEYNIDRPRPTEKPLQAVPPCMVTTDHHTKLSTETFGPPFQEQPNKIPDHLFSLTCFPSIHHDHRYFQPLWTKSHIHNPWMDFPLGQHSSLASKLYHTCGPRTSFNSASQILQFIRTIAWAFTYLPHIKAHDGVCNHV